MTPADDPVAAGALDDRLMRAFAGGDAAAFEQLYARHRQGLYRFVKRLLGSAAGAQADEVFQDTWLRVVQARARWSPQGASFRTWLYTLAHHRAVDCLRRSGRETSLDGGAAGEDERADGAGGDAPWTPSGDAWSGWPSPPAAGDAGGPSTAEDRAFWRAAGRRLLECLDTLPVAQRTVFLLHHEDGMALDELARALELGFETAKSRLRYAMAELRTCMGAYLPAATAIPRTEPR